MVSIQTSPPSFISCQNQYLTNITQNEIFFLWHTRMSQSARANQTLLLEYSRVVFDNWWFVLWVTRVNRARAAWHHCGWQTADTWRLTNGPAVSHVVNVTAVITPLFGELFNYWSRYWTDLFIDLFAFKIDWFECDLMGCGKLELFNMLFGSEYGNIGSQPNICRRKHGFKKDHVILLGSRDFFVTFQMSSRCRY